MRIELVEEKLFKNKTIKNNSSRGRQALDELNFRLRQTYKQTDRQTTDNVIGRGCLAHQERRDR